MTDRPVLHDTFVIERTYPAERARVFAAFTTAEAKEAWGDTGDLESASGPAAETEFEFREGGRELFGHVWQGTTLRYAGTYYDIVPNQRIVYAYEMYADDARISVSVATIEFDDTEGGTALTFTEQGAYLDGIDGAEAPALRREGTTEMLDALTSYLTGPDLAASSQPVGSETASVH